MEDENFVSLRLSRAEALVLFEWLARVDGAGAIPTEHPAEELVMWQLEAQLEKLLHEQFLPTYGESLEAARREVHSAIETPASVNGAEPAKSLPSE